MEWYGKRRWTASVFVIVPLFVFVVVVVLYAAWSWGCRSCFLFFFFFFSFLQKCYVTTRKGNDSEDRTGQEGRWALFVKWARGGGRLTRLVRHRQHRVMVMIDDKNSFTSLFSMNAEPSTLRSLSMPTSPL